MANFSIFFPSDQKNIFGLDQKVPGSKVGQPLIYCGSKVSSGRVGSGPISSLDINFDSRWVFFLLLGSDRVSQLWIFQFFPLGQKNLSG